MVATHGIPSNERLEELAEGEVGCGEKRYVEGKREGGEERGGKRERGEELYL